MNLETILFEKSGKLGRVTLNRPQVLNAVNNQAALDWNTVAESIAADPDLRVVVVTGAGDRSFSTGIDLKQLSAGEIEQIYHHRWERALRILETCDKIIIAAINGWCLGGGLQLALACDIRAARDDAQLGLPAIKECLVPGMGVFRLPRFIGMGRAKRLILSGENVSASEALAIGLVDYVFGKDEFEARVEELAAGYLKVASMGARQSKILTTQAFDFDHATFIEKYFAAQVVATDHPDHEEAMKA
ncbi:MAG: enoyl-CoA hydratase/isomerase family protein, partial [Chloroflexi bacterium]|nr:enoyl-CoA hydratase/isomerase family protein [Chloroflexota bacterium]